ncbi:hypothetical protein ACQE3E_23900 (plasmid) [Methylomonas sp. MED-D]|uniref:hypothetical protein n=1 Tax=Methylomonas sp. MED-D TaxID=3418768 RepID=UPI003D07A0A3
MKYDKPNFKNPGRLMFISPIVFGFFIALLCPENILDKHWLLQSVTSKLKAIFPPIEGYAIKSEFPQVSELYFSLMWALSPYYLFISILSIRRNQGLIDWLPKTQFEVIKVFFTGVVLMSFLGYFCLFVNPGYDFNFLPINSSRFALSVTGYLFSGIAAAILLAVAYCLFEKIVFIAFRR